MNVVYRVELSQTERDELKGLLSAGRQRASLSGHRSCWAADAGASDDDIATGVGVGGSTVYRTKQRIVLGNLEAALREAPRPGASRKLSGKQEAYWSQRPVPSRRRAAPVGPWNCWRVVKLAEHDNLPRDRARRLAENRLKPWRKDMWCIPQVDGGYVAHMEEVLDLYAERQDRVHAWVVVERARLGAGPMTGGLAAI